MKFSGFSQIVKLFLNDFIDINAKDSNGDSAFALAFKNGELKSIS